MTTESINKGNPLERTKCPVSPERLRELHWKQGKCTAQIAVYLATIAGKDKPFARESIAIWMRRASINVRTRQEAGRVRKGKYKNPRRSEFLRQNLAKARESHTQETGQKVLDGLAKARKASARKRRGKSTDDVILVCCRDECRIEFSREKSRTGVYMNHFCGKSCAVKFSHKQKSLEKLRTSKPTQPTAYAFEQLARMSEQDVQKIGG